MTPSDAGRAQRIAAVRGFNRFYTQRIGVLREHLLGSPFSLTGVRVLYELAHWLPGGDLPTATVLAERLALDEGYLSRILRGFEQRGLVTKRRSSGDHRRKALSLTRRGGREFAPRPAFTGGDRLAARATVGSRAGSAGGVDADRRPSARRSARA